MTKEIRAATFSIDDGPSYPGYTDGSDWNGWAKPKFTLEVAKQIAKASSSPNYDVRFDAKEDAFFHPSGFEEIPEPERYDGEDVEVEPGKVLHLYPLGASLWTWDEDE